MAAPSSLLAATWLLAWLGTPPLGVRYGLATYGAVAALDGEGTVVRRYTVDESGRVCIPVLADEEYRIYRLRIERGRDLRPPLQIHFKGGPNARILGMVRVEP